MTLSSLKIWLKQAFMFPIVVLAKSITRRMEDYPIQDKLCEEGTHLEYDSFPERCCWCYKKLK